MLALPGGMALFIALVSKHAGRSGGAGESDGEF